jgi:hypothetical protein
MYGGVALIGLIGVLVLTRNHADKNTGISNEKLQEWRKKALEKEKKAIPLKTKAIPATLALQK